VLCIFYVEDNEDNGYMLKMRLKLTDEFEVLVAENGEKGCESAAERPDLILMGLVRRQVAIAGPITSALMARAATTTIPIVFVAGEDPVALGLMTSLARPGGNVTGINIFANELAAKRLELLREQVPEATQVAVLVNPANPTTAETTARDVQAAARGIESQVKVLDASTSREIDGAFATAFFREPPDALFFVGGDPLFGCRQTI
jgi:putative ABC transport system substrate-binding protein